MKITLLTIAGFMFAAHLVNAQDTVTVTVTVVDNSMAAGALPTVDAQVTTDSPTSTDVAATTETA